MNMGSIGMSDVHKLTISQQVIDGNRASLNRGFYKNHYNIQAVIYILLAITILTSTQNASAISYFHGTQFMHPNYLRVTPMIFNGGKDRFKKFTTLSPKKANYKKLSLTHKRKSRKLNIKTHLSAKYLNTTGQSINSLQAMKINKLYVDASSPRDFVSARLGRQTFNMAGTPYAVDGLAVSYKLFKQQRINLMAGYSQPEPEAVEVNTDKTLYGVSAKSQRFAKYWQTDVYAYEQRRSGITDRQIMGSRLNYAHKKHKAQLQVDVDTVKNETLSSQISYQWAPKKRHSIKMALDYRKPKAPSPKTITALNELLKTMTTNERQTLKYDRTALFRSGALSWSKPLSHNMFLKNEISVSSLSKANFAETLIYNSYYLYELQLSGSNVFKKNDKTRLSLRYFEYNTERRVSISFNNRLPINHNWKADFLIEAYWQKKIDQSQALSFRPLLKLEYNKKGSNKLGINVGMVRFNLLNRPSVNNVNDLFLSFTYSRKL